MSLEVEGTDGRSKKQLLQFESKGEPVYIKKKE